MQTAAVTRNRNAGRALSIAPTETANVDGRRRRDPSSPRSRKRKGADDGGCTGYAKPSARLRSRKRFREHSHRAGGTRALAPSAPVGSAAVAADSEDDGAGGEYEPDADTDGNEKDKRRKGQDPEPDEPHADAVPTLPPELWWRIVCLWTRETEEGSRWSDRARVMLVSTVWHAAVWHSVRALDSRGLPPDFVPIAVRRAVRCERLSLSAPDRPAGPRLSAVLLRERLRDGRRRARNPLPAGFDVPSELVAAASATVRELRLHGCRNDEALRLLSGSLPALECLRLRDPSRIVPSLRAIKSLARCASLTVLDLDGDSGECLRSVFLRNATLMAPLIRQLRHLHIDTTHPDPLLRSASCLTHLSLRNPWTFDLADLPNPSLVRELRVSGAQPPISAVLRAAECARMDLESLAVGTLLHPVDAANVAAVAAAFPHLISLALCACSRDMRGGVLVHLRSLTALRCLDVMVACAAQMEFAESGLAGPDWPALDSLCLRYVRPPTALDGSALPACLSALTRLSIHCEGELGDRLCEAQLRCLGLLTTLRRLELHHFTLASDALERLTAALPRLRRVALRHCRPMPWPLRCDCATCVSVRETGRRTAAPTPAVRAATRSEPSPVARTALRKLDLHTSFLLARHEDPRWLARSFPHLLVLNLRYKFRGSRCSRELDAKRVRSFRVLPRLRKLLYTNVQHRGDVAQF